MLFPYGREVVFATMHYTLDEVEGGGDSNAIYIAWFPPRFFKGTVPIQVCDNLYGIYIVHLLPPVVSVPFDGLAVVCFQRTRYFCEVKTQLTRRGRKVLKVRALDSAPRIGHEVATKLIANPNQQLVDAVWEWVRGCVGDCVCVCALGSA